MDAGGRRGGGGGGPVGGSDDLAFGTGSEREIWDVRSM